MVMSMVANSFSGLSNSFLMICPALLWRSSNNSNAFLSIEKKATSVEEIMAAPMSRTAMATNRSAMEMIAVFEPATINREICERVSIAQI